MPKFSRLIIYEAEDDDILCTQIRKSLPEGVHDKGKIKITVINISSVFALGAFVKDQEENLDIFEQPKEV
jgi:hypothetical protein